MEERSNLLLIVGKFVGKIFLNFLNLLSYLGKLSVEQMIVPRLIVINATSIQLLAIIDI